MANKQHEEFARDSAQWQVFRDTHPDVIPDLTGADFEESFLSGDFSNVRFDDAYMKRAKLPYQLNGASFVKARLRQARLDGQDDVREEFDRRNTVFRDAHMSDAVLRYANFTGADFTGADLRGAKFEGALLINANFTSTHLLDAVFDTADLRGAVFSGARFERTSFARAQLQWTTFDAVDLTGATGLESVEHRAPSVISLSTIYRSGGRVPGAFLAGTQQDIPEDVLLGFRDFFRTLPFDYRSCFVSYASDDADFVDHLTAGLKARGVCFWRDQARLQAGDIFEERIAESINRFDRFLVVLSSHSLRSEWVRQEIDRALLRKKYDMLPIAIDDSVLARNSELPLELRSERHVANFAKWRDPGAFDTQFELLLHALKRE